MSDFRREYHQRRMDDLRRWFSKHQATRVDHVGGRFPITEIVWAEPGTSNYLIVFLIRANTLRKTIR